jgi:hypothetical protein
MDAALAFSLAEQAAACGVSLVFSGGEPMLRKPLVLSIARLVSRSVPSVAVYTNAYWARDAMVAQQIVAELARAGVNTLLMSTDRFHHPYVPAERVEHAARAALDAGLHCEVAVPTPAGDQACSALVSRLKAIPRLAVKVHGLSATGRASRLPQTMFARGIHDRACGIIGELSAVADGSIYCCCAGSVDADASSRLCIGNARHESLQLLFERFRDDPVFADIRSSGPLRAAMLEHARNGAFAAPDQFEFNDICTACRHCFSRSRTLGGVLSCSQ